MREVLCGLRRHTFEAPGPVAAESDFGESFYLATHMTYWISGYTSNSAADAPWLFDYIAGALEYSCGQARVRDQQVARVAAVEMTGSAAAVEAAKAQPVPEADGLDLEGFVYVDLDGVAEACDCLRGLQPRTGGDRGEENSEQDSSRTQALLEEATEWIMRQQMPSGEWPQIWHPDDPLYRKGMFDTAEADEVYNRLHPVWTCTYALCDRPPQARRSSAFAARMERLMREVDFANRPTPVNKSSGSAKQQGRKNRKKHKRLLL
jgi:hypothetical protein